MDFRIKSYWILVLAICLIQQLQFGDCISRNFLKGMTLGVLFGRNILGRHLMNNNNSPMPMMSGPSSCPMPK